MSLMVLAVRPRHQWRIRLGSIIMRQRIVNVVSPGASLFETSTPMGVWGSSRTENAQLDVEFINASLDGGATELEGDITLAGLKRLDDFVETAHTIVVPTWPIATRVVPTQLTNTLRRAHDTGVRIVGLCLGAFAVASTGLLDGRSAVTHWNYRNQFEAAFPAVDFEPNTLYVDHGPIVTSAGSAAALDCCLHLARQDHGAESAAALARSLVTAPHRSGAQSQFASAPPLPQRDDPISLALAHAAEHIAEVGTVERLVELVPMGRRSLERHLKDRLGLSPRAWLNEQRVVAACRLLESTDLSVELVAAEAGYGSTPSLRRALQNNRGTTPTRYRAQFRGGTAG